MQTVTAGNAILPAKQTNKTTVNNKQYHTQQQLNSLDRADLSNADAVCSCETRRQAWNFRRMPTM